MKINHTCNARFNSIYLGDCFKLVDDGDLYIKILVQRGFDILNFNAVNLVNGVATYISDDTEIIAFRDATINTNG
jgi:hypothetical protein